MRGSSRLLSDLVKLPSNTGDRYREAKITLKFVRAQMSLNAEILYGVTVNMDKSERFPVSTPASGIQDV